MKKDKEWLKEKMIYLKEAVGKPAVNDFSRGLNSAYDTLELLIDQLNEPEMTEEQAWNKIGEAYADSEKGRLMNAKKIFDNGLEMQGVINTVMFKLKKSNDDRTFEEFVIDSIKKTELPVVPQFVAEYIDSARRENATLLGAMDYFLNSKEIKSWMRVNQELFARAWLDGYTIEKEKLYKVLLPGVESLDRQMCMHEETKVIGFASDGYNSRKYSKDDEFIRLFTEQEIKAIDERYWAFAEEGTE